MSDQQDREHEDRKKRSLNPRGGVGTKVGHMPYTVSGSQPGTASGTQHPHPVDNASTEGSPYKYWNEDALSRWLGLEIWAGPSWMVSVPGCWSTTVPESTQ